MIAKNRFQKFGMILTGVAIATLLSLTSLLGNPPQAQTSSPIPPDICEIVISMPGAEDTGELLTLLETTRSGVTSDLIAMKQNMEQYDAEEYGWQNVIDAPSALEPRPGSWLIGALRMACEAQPATTVSGTVSYRQRIALPPNAKLVVTLEDVSLADVPSTVIAQRPIRTNGQQVPIPFSLAYDPAEIETRNRYVVRAQIFYGDELSWTSTTAYPVITQGNPTEVAIQVEQV